MENKCGCWALLKRGLTGACKSSASKDSANTIPRTSLVYDAGIYVLLLLLVSISHYKFTLLFSYFDSSFLPKMLHV